MAESPWIWYTIPEFADNEPENVFFRDVDAAAGNSAENSYDHGHKNLHVLARANFFHAKNQGRVRVKITADDSYKLYVNGKFAGQGPAPAYPTKYYYNTIDITPLLQEGQNVLAAHLYYQGLINRVQNSGDGRFAFACMFEADADETRHTDANAAADANETRRTDANTAADADETRCADTSAAADANETRRMSGNAESASLANVNPRFTHGLRWKYQISTAFSGGVTGYETQYLENFDSRLWEDDWNLPTYDDTNWAWMVPAKWADYVLEEQPTKMLSVYPMPPQSMQKKGATWLLDMGQEITGGLRIKAEGHDGDKLVIRCGEELCEDKCTCITEGSQANISPLCAQIPWEGKRVRSSMRCNCNYEEEWILREGENTYESYDYKGFRYVSLSACPEADMERNASASKWQIPAEIKITGFEAIVRHYPMEEDACTLKCDDEWTEQIFQICKNAVKFGTQEGYLDCPTREKGQYLGDAIVTARSQVWLTGSVEMLRKCIDQFAQSGAWCPGLLGVAPGAFWQEIADFSLLWPELLLTDYEFTGDKEFLTRYYPVARHILEWFQTHARPDGLLVNVREKWNMVDWPENLRDDYDFTLSRPAVADGCHNVINALYIGAVKRVLLMEKILGLPSDFDFEALRQAYVRSFYCKEKQLFIDSENSGHAAIHSNLYALYFGLCPDESIQGIADFLVAKGFSCGVWIGYFYLRALAKAGRYKDVYRMLVNDGPHGWVNMLREGATTCFEAWGKEQKWNTSLCHPWASAPISILIEELIGFKPCPEEEDGYRLLPHLPEEIKRIRMTIPFRGKRMSLMGEQGKIMVENVRL